MVIKFFSAHASLYWQIKMILVVVLLLFNPVTSKENKESRCLREVKCLEMEAPICMRVRKRNHTTHAVVNPCEMQRIRCSEGLDATEVPMKNCHYGNETQYLRRTEKNKKKNTKRHEFLPNRVIRDTYERELGFMVDASFNDTERWGSLRTTVKEIAEEAVKYYDVTFFAFSTDGVGGLYTSDRFKNVAAFLDRLYYYTYTGTDYFFKPDFCRGEILSPIRGALNNTKWRPEISYLYVFTHNLAKDYDLVKTWKVDKRTKVTIILMPDCAYRHVRRQPELQVYYEFTTRTGGQLFRMRYDDDVPKLKEFVRHTALAFEPRILKSQVIEQKGSYIPIRVNESVAYVVVTVCGNDVNFAILDDWGNRINPQFLINRADSKVYRFVALPPHTYRVQLDTALITEYGNWNVSVQVLTSKVDFTFEYRLSEAQIWRAVSDAASKKPKYVIIRVTDKRDLVDINKIKFIELDENDKEEVFASYKLAKMADNVYATEYKVIIPTHDFFMVASGTLKGTKKEVDSREIKYTPSAHQDDSSETQGGSRPQLLALHTTTKTARWQRLRLRGSCPKQCAVRDVMVCARCQHGVEATFMSECHMRLFECTHPGDDLILVARRPCLSLGPFMGEMPRPAEHMAEPNDEDHVLTHVYKREKFQPS